MSKLLPSIMKFYQQHFVVVVIKPAHSCLLPATCTHSLTTSECFSVKLADCL